MANNKWHEAMEGDAARQGPCVTYCTSTSHGGVAFHVLHLLIIPNSLLQMENTVTDGELSTVTNKLPHKHLLQLFYKFEFEFEYIF